MNKEATESTEGTEDLRNASARERNLQIKKIQVAQKARWNAYHEKNKKDSMSKNEIVKADSVEDLADMTLPQLTGAFKKLNEVGEYSEKLSGICATMQGLVLIEVKRKLAHGEFLPWLNSNFSKTRKTAAQYMRLTGAFLKCDPKLHLKVLRQDLAATLKLLEKNRLNFKNPIVAEVAEWTKGRSRSQLLLDFGQGKAGGNHPRKGPPPTPEELAREQEQEALDLWRPTINDLELWGLEKKTWAHLPRAEMERLHGALVDLSRELGRALKNPEP